MVAGDLALLRELSALDPPLFVLGSVAEAVLLEGKLAESADVDSTQLTPTVTLLSGLAVAVRLCASVFGNDA